MKNIKYIFSCLLIIGCITGCGSSKKIEDKPEITQIRAICDLATLETYYHNVAKLNKPAGGGINSLLQKDRVLWIKYTGIARIGIELSKVNMDIEGTKVTVNIPKAKVLSINVSEEALNKDSYYYSEDNKIFFKNEFTAEDETLAINEAQDNMKKQVENDDKLLMKAQERAKKLIEKYIKELGNLSGIDYSIQWSYEE